MLVVEVVFHYWIVSVQRFTLKMIMYMPLVKSVIDSIYFILEKSDNYVHIKERNTENLHGVYKYIIGKRQRVIEI